MEDALQLRPHQAGRCRRRWSACSASTSRAATNTIGGITVDSEYIIFVIDTSGSMFSYAWPLVQRKVSETLRIYPRVKGIQVMNDMGDYMFSQYAGQWIPDSAAIRRGIVDRACAIGTCSRTRRPVEGIEKRAINGLLRRGQEDQHLRVRRRLPRHLHRRGGGSG